MNQPQNPLFEASPCPSEQTLQAYVTGRLPEDQIRKVEAHISGCPVCSDMVDGLMQMKDPGDLDAISNELMHRAAARKPKMVKLVRPMIYAVAASLIILIGMLAVFRWVVPATERSKISQNETVIQTKEEGVNELSAIEESSETRMGNPDQEVSISNDDLSDNASTETIMENDPETTTRETREEVSEKTKKAREGSQSIDKIDSRQPSLSTLSINNQEVLAEKETESKLADQFSIAGIREAEEEPAVFVVDGIQESRKVKSSRVSGSTVKKSLFQSMGPIKNSTHEGLDSTQWKALFVLAKNCHQLGFDPYALYLLHQIPSNSGYSWYPEARELIEKLSQN
jgi:hypothetical protein